ncbi:MAG: hypothetical protein Q9227_007821 [Pyrenula ochraceoflavens]
MSQPTYFVGQMIEHLATTRIPGYSNFESLNEVSFYCSEASYYDDVALNMREVLPLFYLPSIENLHLIHAENSRAQWLTAPNPLQYLRSVNLDMCRIRESQLASMLELCPRLETLRYYHETQPYTDVNGEPGVVDCETLGKALRSVKATLSHLELGISFYTTCAEDIRESAMYGFAGLNGCIGSLKEFPRLHFLRAPFVLLFGWDGPRNLTLDQLLPQQLKTLVLSDDLGNWDEYAYRQPELESIITHALSRKRTAMPYLEELGLSINYTGYYHDPERSDIYNGFIPSSVREACAKANVFDVPYDVPWNEGWG